MPILLYNSEIWGAFIIPNKHIFKNATESIFEVKLLTENLHMIFMKLILGVHSKTCDSAVRSELGREPMHVKIYISVLKYWARVNQELKDSPIIMGTLDANMKLSQSNKNSWFSTVHHILKSVDQLSAWKDPSTIKSIDSFGLNIKKKLRSKFIDIWETQMSFIGSNNFRQNKYIYSKLNRYKKIKSKFRMKEYLLRIESREIRQSVTKFRMSGHKFPIESDRYIKIPKELRIFDICREGIGDEYHYFLHCNHVLLELSKDNSINKIRNINKSLMLLDSHSLVVSIMSDRNIINILAKFIHELMNVYELVAAKCC